MQLYTMVILGVTIILFLGSGLYLRSLRKKAEKQIPKPFLNPSWKRKKKK